MPHLTDSLPPQDIMVEVRKFICGTARPTQSSNTLELTRTALNLLKNVPATREAVLEYFCSVFFVAVTKYMRQIEVRLHCLHSPISCDCGASINNPTHTFNGTSLFSLVFLSLLLLYKGLHTTLASKATLPLMRTFHFHRQGRIYQLARKILSQRYTWF
jgi:hypothetical protein